MELERHMKLFRNPLALAVAGTIAASANLASAQMLEEVVVTAQKREQSLQDVGIAVTAFSGDTMQAMGIDSISKIQDMTPNLRIKSTINDCSCINPS